MICYTRYGLQTSLLLSLAHQVGELLALSLASQVRAELQAQERRQHHTACHHSALRRKLRTDQDETRGAGPRKPQLTFFLATFRARLSLPTLSNSTIRFS